ncbi:MAG: hypothetical protein G8345_07905 [Magnetococcales bacterium]|nr:hypothetical protein [Magnetococcales bacterium]
MRITLWMALWAWFVTHAVAANALPPHLLAFPGEGRDKIRFSLKGGEASQVHIFSPVMEKEVVVKPLNQGAGEVSLAGGQGGYHWLAASWLEGEVERVATTAHFVALPGPSPVSLLKAAKNPLEIIPQPLPREHQRYRGGETWPFLLRFAGEPLVDKGVVLYSQGQTPVTFRSDQTGMVRVTFPIPDEKASHGGKHGRHGPQFPFVLEVTHRQGERGYATTFAHSHGPHHGRDLPYGAGLGLMGFVLGSFFLHRRRPAS